MTKWILFISVILLTGCATTQSGEVWNDNSVTNLKVGMTKTQVETIFGKPTRTQAFSGNRSASVYLRPSDDSKGMNSYIKFMTLGTKIMVADALSIMFKDGKVSDFKYEENADNNMVEAGGFKN